jgi:hypothetical protein
LENAIIFLLSHAGLTHESLRDPQRALVYQITEDNKYHLGFTSLPAPDGWEKYIFKYDPHIISLIIQQHIKEQVQSISIYDYADGSTEKGFLLTVKIPDNLKNPYGCYLATIEPYKIYYAK